MKKLPLRFGMLFDIIFNKKLAILSVCNCVSISGDTRRVERLAWVAVVGGVDLGGGQVVIMVRCFWWCGGQGVLLNSKTTQKWAIFKLPKLS